MQQCRSLPRDDTQVLRRGMSRFTVLHLHASVVLGVGTLWCGGLRARYLLPYGVTSAPLRLAALRDATRRARWDRHAQHQAPTGDVEWPPVVAHPVIPLLSSRAWGPRIRGSRHA